MPQESPWLNAARYASIGTEFGVTFVLGILAGVWLDRRTGREFPLFTLLGAAAGFTAGMIRLVRQARKYQAARRRPSDGQ